MAGFGIRFFLCNILICVIITMLLMAKRALKNHLTSRMQFQLWFLLLGLLAVPFLPVRPAQFLQVSLWLGKLKNTVSPNMEAVTGTAGNVSAPGPAGQIHDFALSVSSRTPSVIGLILFMVWVAGILAMLLLMAKSRSRLRSIKKSALPLQNREIRMLYSSCLSEMKIKRVIPVYSTAFLKSPIITGLFRPCIYLPVHLISDFRMADKGQKEIQDEGAHMADESQKEIQDEEAHMADKGQKKTPRGRFHAADMRYMLLHELQHYKHKDFIGGCLMSLAGVLYWFNPFVWHALKEMCNDREAACDASVLKLLDESDYEDYGNTLINFAEKASQTPFPFVSGISGTMRQMQKRIIHISSYQKPSVWKRIKGAGIFTLIAVMLFELAPMLSTDAAGQSHYNWNISPEKVNLIDLSAYFHGYKGSFVLYDLKNDAWTIYGMDRATLRTAPDSTYKIYSALFGLEEGIITPEDSSMAWNGTDYPFEAWNADQDLHSAMQSSVNWYFQEIDGQLGTSAIRSYMKKIGYGNEAIHAGLSPILPNAFAAAGEGPGSEGGLQDGSPFWMQSELKISPVEQVELLVGLYSNRFGFAPENIKAVKDSICLDPSSLPNIPAAAGTSPGIEGCPQGVSSEAEGFYGKTGTGRVDGNDINGWFIGYAETAGSTYFFAANIQAAENATGSKASEISLSILSSLGIWKP